jgi:predicted Zn-dependent protease
MYPSSDKSDAALYARAIARMRAGDLASAKTGTLTLISRHRDSPYFYELLGDIEFQYGHYDDSIEAYEKSLGELGQNKEQIELALALALAERKKDGDLARAAGLAKRTLLSEPMPLAYWVLAKSDAGKSDYYLAEYYYLTKDLPRAKGHAKTAVRKLPADSPEYLKAADILDM